MRNLITGQWFHGTPTEIQLTRCPRDCQFTDELNARCCRSSGTFTYLMPRTCRELYPKCGRYPRPRLFSLKSNRFWWRAASTWKLSSLVIVERELHSPPLFFSVCTRQLLVTRMELTLVNSKFVMFGKLKSHKGSGGILGKSTLCEQTWVFHVPVKSFRCFKKFEKILIHSVSIATVLYKCTKPSLIRINI